MGRDFTLSDKHPSIIINGQKYHYGIDIYKQYMVESAHYEKDYWYFKEKEDLEAFLINLPESADRNLRLKLHPDWRDVTPEQRDAYFEQDKLLFRAWAEEKVRNGTAQSFNMDLEGEHGPYEPQRIESRSQVPPIERVGRQLADYKASEAVNAQAAGYQIGPGEWPLVYTEALKLRVVEGNLDWTGVAARDKEAVLAREIDFSGITPEQFRFVYEDIAFDKVEPADPAVAQALFDRSRSQAGQHRIRQTTRNLVESIMLDVWPRSGAIIDFGLKSQEHYEALYYPVREGEITPEQLDAALGKGEKLTALVRSARNNPHRDIAFRTDWDDLLPEPDHPGNGGNSSPSSSFTPAGQPPHPWPSEIARANRQNEPAQSQGHNNGQDKSNGRDDGNSM